MSGIVGLFSQEPVNQRLYDSLLLLQHRGQDAAGIGTLDGLTIHVHKALGMVTEAFRTRNMRELTGTSGVGQARALLQGENPSSEQCQPLYVYAPYGILFVNNGRLINGPELKQELYDQGRRHVNSDDDSEVMLNVLAEEIAKRTQYSNLTPQIAFDAVRGVQARCHGSYACVALIAGKGMLAFRDPLGIRPLGFGVKESEKGREVMFASESVVMQGQDFPFERDVKPGEAIFVDMKGEMHFQDCAEHAKLMPCAFEWVYLARPDSVMDGISVYNARLRLGEYLADEVARQIPLEDIDVVMPIPDSSRPSAQQLAAKLNLCYREGYIKNRYVGRTFILPDQEVRKKTVRQKLNAMPIEFKGKNVLLVDDSIVRGTTMREIVRMTREAGAKKVYVASGAPRVCFPNVYGIDMPTKTELICGDGKDADAVARELGADKVVYQRLEDLPKALLDLNPNIDGFEMSCFDGNYITGDVSQAYLDKLEAEAIARKALKK